MALSSLSQLELLFHAGMDENALGIEIDAWIEDVQKNLFKITEVEAILRRYYQNFVIAVEEKDRNEKSISELKEEITECECDEKGDNADLALKKIYKILKQYNKTSSTKLNTRVQNYIKSLRFYSRDQSRRENKSHQNAYWMKRLECLTILKRIVFPFHRNPNLPVLRNNRRRHVSSTK